MWRYWKLHTLLLGIYNSHHRLEFSSTVCRNRTFELLLELDLECGKKIFQHNYFPINGPHVFHVKMWSLSGTNPGLLPNFSGSIHWGSPWTLGSTQWTLPTRGLPHWSTFESVSNWKWDPPPRIMHPQVAMPISFLNPGAPSHEETELQSWASSTCCSHRGDSKPMKQRSELWVQTSWLTTPQKLNLKEAFTPASGKRSMNPRL